MSCFHRCFLSNRIILYRLNKLILLLLHLVFFTLHYDFLQFFLIFFTFFFYSIAKSFPQFKSISFDLIVFFSCEFMTLTSVPNVASPLLNISTLKPFLVQIIKVSQWLWHHCIRRVGALQCFDQIICNGAFVRSNKSHCVTLITSSASSPHSVNIVFEMVRTNIIDNKLDVFNVKTSSADTSCNQDVSYLIFKVLNRKFSICLVHPTVQYKSFVSYLE